jgi:hypothetical protein
MPRVYIYTLVLTRLLVGYDHVFPNFGVVSVLYSPLNQPLPAVNMCQCVLRKLLSSSRGQLHLPNGDAPQGLLPNVSKKPAAEWFSLTKSSPLVSLLGVCQILVLTYAPSISG